MGHHPNRAQGNVEWDPLILCPHFLALFPGEAAGPEHLATPEKLNPFHLGLGQCGMRSAFSKFFLSGNRCLRHHGHSPSREQQPFMISGNLFLSQEATVLNFLKVGQYLASIPWINISMKKTFTVVGAL